MSFPRTTALLVAFCSSVAGGEPAKTPDQVAGRTVSGWSRDLEHANVFVRLRAAKTLGVFGPRAAGSLIRALDDQDAGVRYWAASHLADMGDAAKPAVPRLRKLRQSQRHPAVAMAAAFALCRLDTLDGNLELLVERLRDPERGMACSAAEMLGRLGPAAKSAVAALEQTYRRHHRRPGEPGPVRADYHVRGAAQNALRKIQPGWKSK